MDEWNISPTFAFTFTYLFFFFFFCLPTNDHLGPLFQMPRQDFVAGRKEGFHSTNHQIIFFLGVL
jgi:hypothetical protein